MFRTTTLTRTLTRTLTHLRPPRYPLRTFTTTPHPPKKASRSDHHHNIPATTPPPAGTFDFTAHFSNLETELSRILERLKDELSKLRTTRADPASFESVVVTIDKASGATALLRDVAHVVPRGRAVAVTVYEAANVKKVVAAIQRADLGTPVVDPKSGVVSVALPPPTKESRVATVDAAGKAGEKALMALRGARQGSHKTIKGLKGMSVDDVWKADKQLEKIMEKVGGEAKKIVEGAKKAIMEA